MTDSAQVNSRHPRRIFFGLRPVARKEFTHILRDPSTLFFALLIPILQLFLFGYAVDTNVRQVPTVLWLNALILTLMGSAAILTAAYAFVKQNAV